MSASSSLLGLSTLWAATAASALPFAAPSSPPCLAELLDIAATPQLNSSLWNASNRVANPEWNGERPVLPAFIAFPRDAADVQRCLRCASKEGVRVAVKAGGHSFGGYGLLPAEQGFAIHLRLMADVTPVMEHDGEATVTAQAGARWRDVYQSFKKSGKEWVVNGGLCPSVGVAGFTMGGGVGPAARLHGMAIDSVQSFTMVRATGNHEIVTASADSNPDLFWALRGGGGGNFGVVTSLTFQVHPGPDLYAFGELCFEANQAANLMAAMNALEPKLSRTVNADAVMDGDLACLWVTAMETLKDTRAALEPFLAAMAPAKPAKDTLREKNCWWEGISDFAVEHEYTEYDDDPYYSKNCLVDTVPPALASTLVNLTAAAPKNCGGQHFIAFGGRVAEVAPDATAFPWRSTAYMVYTSCSYTTNDGGASRKEAIDFLAQWEEQVFPHCNGGSYVNFIDPLAGPNGLERYYGANLARLREVKRRWNPSGAGPLHFPMEILDEESSVVV